MLLVEEALAILLRANAALVTLVGNRIYPGALSQTVAYPAIAYRLVDREHVTNLTGRTSSGLARSRFWFISTGKGLNGYADSKRVNEALRLCLFGYHGVVSNTSSPVVSLDIHNIVAVRTEDLYDDATQTYQVGCAYDVWAAEARPPEL